MRNLLVKKYYPAKSLVLQILTKVVTDQTLYEVSFEYLATPFVWFLNVTIFIAEAFLENEPFMHLSNHALQTQ